MMKELLLLLFSLLLCVPAFAADEKTGAAKTQSTVSAAAPFRTVTAPVIIDRPVRLTEYRKQLTREYAFQHYGEEFTEIVPQVVVVHWTELPEADGVYEYFYKEARADGTLNVCSQFLVDRDGTIFRLTPETMLDRHAPGAIAGEYLAHPLPAGKVSHDSLRVGSLPADGGEEKRAV